LPKDDGEFYQFCYVAASGHVRGASPPFQFKHPMTDDLIEIEDENGELLVIRTKTAVLEDQLKKANETRAELKQVSSVLSAVWNVDTKIVIIYCDEFCLLSPNCKRSVHYIHKSVNYHSCL